MAQRDTSGNMNWQLSNQQVLSASIERTPSKLTRNETAIAPSQLGRSILDTIEFETVTNEVFEVDNNSDITLNKKGTTYKKIHSATDTKAINTEDLLSRNTLYSNKALVGSKADTNYTVNAAVENSMSNFIALNQLGWVNLDCPVSSPKIGTV
jgi:hypothetical protein